MEHIAFLIEDDKHRISEASGVAQPFHQFEVSVLLGNIDVYVDIVLFNNMGYLLVFGDKIGKP